MAGNTLQWTFKVFDKMSAPAKTIAGALGGFGEKLKQVMRNLHDLDHVMGAIQKGKQLFDWMRAKLGGVIDAMAFKQNSLIALSAMMGSRDAAKEMFEWVEMFAGRTGQKVADVMGRTKELLTAGFKVGDIKVLSQAISDLAVIDPSKAEAFTFALAQTQRLGYATQRSMLALRSSGLQMEPVFRTLAGLYHTNVDGLKKLYAAGKVSAAALTFAATRQVQQQFSGGRLGSVTAERAATLPGVIERLKMLPHLFVDAVVGLEGGVSRKVAGGLERIVNALDPSKPQGKKLVAGVREIFGRLADYLEKVDVAKVASFFVGLGKVIEGVASAVSILVAVFQTVGEVLGGGIGGIVDMVRDFGKDIGNVGAAVKNFAVGLFDAGVALIDGLIGGIKSRVLAAVDAVKEVGEAVVGGLKALLGIHSPSAVFEGLGRSSAAGFQKGLGQGIAGVEGATVRVAGAATGGARRRAAGRGGPLIGSLSVTVQVAPGTPGEIAQRIADEVVHKLGSAFEQLALEQGAL